LLIVDSRFIDINMAKGIFIATVVVCSVVATDTLFNDGALSNGALAMLQQIARSFGF